MKREDRIWEVPQPISTCQVALDDGTVTVYGRNKKPDTAREEQHGKGGRFDRSVEGTGLKARWVCGHR